MALIEFSCRACGQRFEELVFSSDRDKVVCPGCGSGPVDQVFQGKCYGGGVSSGSGCSGNCAGCSGCCR